MKRFHLINVIASFSVFAYTTLASGVTRLNQSGVKTQGELRSEEPTEPKQAKTERISKRSQYNLRLGASRVTFPELKYFDTFYGSSPTQFSISSDWQYYSSDFLNLGLGGQISYLTLTGKQKVNPDVSDPDPSQLQNAEGKLSLTLLPYQLLLTASIKPMGAGSFFTVDFWLGYEELYFQEVRLQSSNTSSKSSNKSSLSASKTPSTKASESTSNKSIVNTGWNNGVVAGVSLNFLLNKLGEKNIGSMKRSMGLGAIYISPYFEIVNKIGGNLLIAQQKSNKISFAHQNIGLAFTFKTAP